MHYQYANSKICKCVSSHKNACTAVFYMFWWGGEVNLCSNTGTFWRQNGLLKLLGFSNWKEV